MRAVITPLRVVNDAAPRRRWSPSLVPFLHDETPALLIGQFEFCNGRGRGCLFVWCLDVAKVLCAGAEDGDAPPSELRGGGPPRHFPRFRSSRPSSVDIRNPSQERWNALENAK
jgi:hypothetical protein